MKLTAFILLAAVLNVSANGYAQVVTLTEKNASMQKIFRQIYKQTGYQFFYEDNLLDKAGRIDLSVKGVSIEEALNQSFKDLPLSYAIVNKTIVVNAKKENSVNPPSVEAALPIDVTGRITNEAGEPQAGVLVLVKGTQRGTYTDGEGYYSINGLNETDVLLISALNIETQEILVGNKTLINITVVTKVSELDEVQVIAYGTTIKRLQTGSVSTVKADVLERQSVTNPIEALQGRASGLYITNTAGAIGAAPTIQIRGVNTLNSGVPVASQPLYVLDGAIIPGSGIVASPGSANPNATLGSYWGQEGGVNPFTFLNPNDIESIEVLKDADATAIYGSRGTNGVIIITTKKGKAGATKFNVDVNTGWTQAAYLPERMNTEQFLKLRTDAFAMGNPTAANPVVPITPTAANAPDLISWKDSDYTDWTRFEYDNPARNYNLQFNMSGGTKDLNFLASLGYVKNEDITRGDPFQERLSGLFNLNHTSRNNRLSVTLSNNISSDQLRPSTATLVFPATLRALPPNMPLTNPDGTPFWPTNAQIANVQNFIPNPFAGERVNTESGTFSFISNLNASYKVLDFMTLKLQGGYTNQLNNSFTTIPSTAINPFVAGTFTPRRSESQSLFESINIEPQLALQHSIGKSKFDGLIGSTFFERNTRTFGLEIDGFDTDELLGSWAGGANVFNKRSTFFKYRFNSIFARVNYNYDGKYLLNATFRRDGSSRFGPENQWANFASMGLGWVFSEEKFLADNSVLSFGKLRGSFGSTGNDLINDFRFTSLFTSTNIIYGDLIGLAPAFLSVPGFQWESTNKMDLALELGFFDDRILLITNWFRNLSTDLLVNQRIPSQTGFTSYLGNFPGVIENKGWEFELTTQNTKSGAAFGWKTNFNLSLLRNTLLEYPDLENSPNSNSLRLGEAIPNPAFPSNLVRPFIFDGVNPANGLPIFRDINGDEAVSTSGFNDRDFIGSTFPKYFGGINNSFSYKGFTLDVFVYFARQLTTNHLYLSPSLGQLFNPVSDIAGNYWTTPDEEAIYPRLYTGVGAQNALLSNYYSNSSAVIDEVFFARLRNLSLSWRVPDTWLQKARIADLKIYLRGQNLFTYSSVELFKDPEAINPRGVIPQSVMTGINISF